MDDLNKLNKNQIVLLTLLVSFVTSIATGIVTVTLIQQAPPSITQPVERVVLRTVEKVVESGEPRTIVKEVPVIITEEQLIVEVVGNASPSVVTITGSKVGATTTSVLSVGFVARADGLIVASNQITLEKEQVYKVKLANGKEVEASLVSDPTAKIAVLKLKEFTAVKPLSLSGEDLAVGQTVIAVGSTGVESSAVAVGIVSGVTKADEVNLGKIRTSAANIDNIGAPLLNVKGKVVGFSEGSSVALTQDAIKLAIDSI